MSSIPEQRVVADPSVLDGVPHVRGTRLPVAVILGGLAEGLSDDEIRDEYPQLTHEDIRAALAYAAERCAEPVQTVAFGRREFRDVVSVREIGGAIGVELRRVRDVRTTPLDRLDAELQIAVIETAMEAVVRHVGTRIFNDPDVPVIAVPEPVIPEDAELGPRWWFSGEWPEVSR